MDKEFIDMCNNSNIGEVIKEVYYEDCNGEEKKLDKIEEEFLDYLKNKSLLILDLKYLNGNLSKEDMEDLNKILTILGIKTLNIGGIEKSIKFDALPIEKLYINGVENNVKNYHYKKFHKLECDYSQLENLKCLKSDHVISLDDVSNLPNIEECYSTIGIIVNSKDEFKKINQLSGKGYRQIVYNGTDVINSDDLKILGDKVIIFTANPLVIGDDICDNFGSCDIRISILGDGYIYSLDEIKNINKELRNMLKDAPSKDASDFEKAVYLYFLVGLNNYDYDVFDKKDDFDEDQYNLISGLKSAVLDKKCVCGGYTMEYYVLAKELGLECNCLAGNVIKDKEGNTIGHAWNQVKIDGKWYNIDVTSDRFEGRNDYGHFYSFLIDDKHFNKNKSDIIKENFDFSKSYEMDKPEKCNDTFKYNEEQLKLLGYYANKFWKDKRKDDKTHRKQDDEYGEI